MSAQAIAAVTPSTSVLQWSEAEVITWLRAVLRASGHPTPLVTQLERHFLERGITGPLLLALDESDLQVDLRLEANIPRKRLLVELAGLRERVHRERLAEAENRFSSQAGGHPQADQMGVTPSQHLAPLAARAACKLINDPIHGHILLEPELVKIIDTPQFQRLRDLKQLGTSYYVFPGASHNRFEHSIGTAHLAGLLLQFLRHHQPELRITSREILLVKIAGLCHDLGHGPFSHAFDNEFIPMARPDDEWSHEDASIMMLDDILASEPGINLSPREVRFVKELINPSQFEPETFPDRGFLYDVVANYRNSMDVDKFDYICRDTFKLGMKSNFDHLRLMHHVRVINNQICFHSKEVTNVYTLFQQRFLLHRSVYSHKVAKAIEYMVTDALLAADPVLKISDTIRDPKRYVKLSDALLLRIEHSDDVRLAPAQAIIQRLRRRDLYKLVTEALLPTNVDTRLRYVTPEDICDAQPASATDGSRVLEPGDLRIHNLALNYARQDKNPVERIRFFTDWNSTTSVLIPEHKVSFMLPQQFQERWLRVYLKHPTKEKIAAAREATRAFFDRYDCFSPGGVGLPYSFSQETRTGRDHHHLQQQQQPGLDSLIEDSDSEDFFGSGRNSVINSDSNHVREQQPPQQQQPDDDDDIFGTPSKPSRPSGRRSRPSSVSSATKSGAAASARALPGPPASASSSTSSSASASSSPRSRSSTPQKQPELQCRQLLSSSAAMQDPLQQLQQKQHRQLLQQTFLQTPGSAARQRLLRNPPSVSPCPTPLKTVGCKRRSLLPDQDVQGGGQHEAGMKTPAAKKRVAFQDHD